MNRLFAIPLNNSYPPGLIPLALLFLNGTIFVVGLIEACDNGSNNGWTFAAAEADSECGFFKVVANAAAAVVADDVDGIFLQSISNERKEKSKKN